jgi:hypothetical protein
MARAPNQLTSFLNMGADLQPRLWQLRHNTEKFPANSLIAGNLRSQTGSPLTGSSAIDFVLVFETAN